MKKIQIKGLLMAGLLLLAGNVIGQDVVGKWKTIDDESGKQKSIVQLFISGISFTVKFWKHGMTTVLHRPTSCVINVPVPCLTKGFTG